MSDKTILASPNWYNSGVCDVSRDGILAFGGKNTIYLLDLTDPLQCRLSGQLCGHKDRVSSVYFSKAAAYARLCVSGSEDRSVIVWDIDAKTSTSKHTKHEVKVTSVCWSSVSPEWIISGDETGHILSWNHQLNQVYEHKPMNGNIVCLTCSPAQEDLVVVGYKTGQMLVVSLKNEKHDIISLLKGHDDEIHSLVWSPVRAGELPRELLGVPNNLENACILASGSRDKTIRLWDMSSGHFIASVTTPTRSAARKGSRDEQQVKSRLWTTLCWSEADPTCLLSSGYGGDVLVWDLSQTSKQRWQLFGGAPASRHNRIVFNICQYPTKDIVVTVSMDRLITVWSRHDGKLLCSLPTLGGFVYSMDIALLDPSSVAVGVGDNMIRVWDTSSSKQPYVMKTLWRGIGKKVMKVTWHPIKEGILGFGTEEGKVGLYNVMSQTYTVSRTYHKKSVYSLSWGPACGVKGNCADDTKVWHLYSCGGEGAVLEHKPENLNDVATNIGVLVKATNNLKHNLAGHSEVCWKKDRRVVAVGNEDGSIHLYRAPDLKMLSTINVHNKSITCLAWYCGPDEEENSCFLASSSNAFDIHIHDLSAAVQEVDQGSQNEVPVVTDSFQRLVGHSGRVTNIVWSPHDAFRVASSSYDGSVQIWDAYKAEGLANYRAHNGRVMSVVWSIMDPDVIYSGGDDFTVRCWGISQQPLKSPPAESTQKFAKAKSKKKKSPSVSQDVDAAHVVEKSESTVDEMRTPIATNGEVEEHRETSVESNNQMVDSVVPQLEMAAPKTKQSVENGLEFLVTAGVEMDHSSKLGHGATQPEPILSVKGESKKKKKKLKSMFPLSATADNKSKTVTSKECIEIAKHLYGDEDTMSEAKNASTGSVNFGLFTSREAACKMLSREGLHHLESGNIDMQLQLEVWKGNIGGALEVAVKKRQLSDWLVAMSHLAGSRVQQVVTKAYAEQLANQGNHHRAALYYVACHKVYDAIHMFHKAGMYREALALAKVRLLPSDPILLDVYSSWARKLENECAYEQAAKCYLACGLCDDAIRVLSRRNDEANLVAAAKVAKLTGRVDQSEALIVKCALSAIRSARWNDALQMLENYPNMQIIRMMLYTHETLLCFLKTFGAISSEDLPNMQHVVNTKDMSVSPSLPEVVTQFKARHERQGNDDCVSQWEFAGNSECDLLCQILEKWWSYAQLNTYENRFHGFYVQITALPLGQTAAVPGSVDQFLMTIAKEVCLGVIASLVAKPDISLQHFLRAIAQCHGCGRYSLLRALCILVFPFGLDSWRMLTELCQPSIENKGSSVDAPFQNVIAFYHRALLDEALIAWNSTSEQCSIGDTDENASHLISAKNSGEELPASTTKNSGQTFGLAQQCMTVQDFYRVVSVASTILLSTEHAKFHGNSEGESEKGLTQAENECARQDSASNVKSMKFPFPDVIDSARAIVTLCLSLLGRNTNSDQHGFTTLAQQVIDWALRHTSDAGDNRAFFQTANYKLEALQSL